VQQNNFSVLVYHFIIFWEASFKLSVMLAIAIDVCLSVCLSHSCTMLKPLDGMRCHLARTFVYPQVALYQSGPGPAWEREIWGSELPVKICIASCSQTDVVTQRCHLVPVTLADSV